MLRRIVPLAMLLTLVTSLSAGAIEVRLRPECTPAGRLVTLGDVAQILPEGEQARALAETPLFPPPPSGRARSVRASEIMEILALRSVSFADVAISGAAEVKVRGGTGEARADTRRLSGSVDMNKARERITTAIEGHLRPMLAADAGFTVQVDPSFEQARQILALSEPLRAEGGMAPWTGTQQFVLRSSKQRDRAVAVEASIAPRLSIVVASRDLRRGELVTAADIRLEVLAPGRNNLTGFERVEEVLGREVTRGVPQGQPLPRDGVQAPRLVARGEIVTVFAHNAGVRVRVPARAKEDGGKDDLVLVESLENRKTYYARVTGSQQVEVYAQAARVSTQREAAANIAPQELEAEQEQAQLRWRQPKGVAATVAHQTTEPSNE